MPENLNYIKQWWILKIFLIIRKIFQNFKVRQKYYKKIIKKLQKNRIKKIIEKNAVSKKKF